MNERIHASDLKTLHHFDAGPFMVHNEWEGLINNEQWKKPGDKLPLLKILFANPNLELFSEATRSAREDEPRLDLSGRVEYGSDVGRPAENDYFKRLGELIEPYGLTVMDSLFKDIRIITPGKGRVIGEVSLSGSYLQMTNNTRHYFTNNKHVGVSASITPPTFTELANKQHHYDTYTYFRDTLRTHILATVAFAECVTGNRVEDRTDILITGHGATYLYDETAAEGTPLRKRLLLTKASTEAKAEETTPSTQTDAVAGEDVFEFLKRSSDDSKVTIADVATTAEVREKLIDVAYAYSHPEVFQKWGARKPCGILLYGPSGTGKTTAARALANQIGGDLWEIKASDITEKWLGDTEKNMQALFDKAKEAKVCTVMFWDEIDSLIGGSGGNGSGSNALAAARGIFKREVADIGESAPNVVLIGATNNPDLLDNALIRAGRFDTKIYMGPPSELIRKQLFANKISDIIQRHETDDVKIYSPDLNIVRLAELTDEWVGTDIVELLRRVQTKKAVAEIRGGSPQLISQDDLELEIRLYRLERSGSDT